MLCNRYRIPVMPGVMTIKEIQEALELGADIVKLFPGNLYDPSMIKAIKGLRRRRISCRPVVSRLIILENGLRRGYSRRYWLGSDKRSFEAAGLQLDRA